ncbi:creatininase family protein [Noviherbaspirillum galbum]|nr:creatininase family protein [Noviherbaspirillum galbum]
MPAHVHHGSPLHNLMLDQAGDYFHDTYGGTMLNLPGLALRTAEPAPARSETTLAEEGRFEVHAGMSETSRILFLRPDLVAANYGSAPPNTANSPAEAVTIARRAGLHRLAASRKRCVRRTRDALPRQPLHSHGFVCPRW